MTSPTLILMLGIAASLAVEPPPQEPDDVEPPGAGEVEPEPRDPEPTPEIVPGPPQRPAEGEASGTDAPVPTPASNEPTGPTPNPGIADPANWHVSLDLQTDFPVSFGLTGMLEMPAGVYLQVTVGWLPSLYLDFVNELARSAGAYDHETASLISAALDDSLVIRTHVGWRPLEDWGLYFGAGYGLLALGGGAASTDLWAVVTGVTPPDVGDERVMVDISSMVHMIDLEVGYEWHLWDQWLIRVALGAAFTASADTSLDARWSGTPRPDGLDTLEHHGAGWLEDTLESHIHTLTFTVAVRHRFF